MIACYNKELLINVVYIHYLLIVLSNLDEIADNSLYLD
jgi:hypothetical protein